MSQTSNQNHAHYKKAEKLVSLVIGDMNLEGLEISVEDRQKLVERCVKRMKSMNVVCEECGEEFDWRELQEDYIDDEYGYDSSNRICPRCGCWDCCEVEFQK